MVVQEIYIFLIKYQCKLLYMAFSYKSHFVAKNALFQRKKITPTLKTAEPLNAQSSSLSNATGISAIRICTQK